MKSDHAGCLTPDRNEPLIDDVDADDFDSPDSESSGSVSSEKTAQHFENRDDSDCDDDYSSACDWSSQNASEPTQNKKRRIRGTKTVKHRERSEKVSRPRRPIFYCKAVGCKQSFRYPRYLENHEREVHLGSSFFSFLSILSRIFDQQSLLPIHP